MTFDGRIISNVGVLAAIVEGGSFARAADALGLSRSGVSRAVSRLEARVGVQLLDRTTRVVSLTDEGRRFYTGVAPLLTGIDEVVSSTSKSAVSVRGRLRVNVDAFFSSLLLAPHLNAFLTRHPDLKLDIVARDQLGDLIGDGFDLAVRFGAPPIYRLSPGNSWRRARSRWRLAAISSVTASRSIPAISHGHACIQVQGLADWPADRRMGVQTRQQAGKVKISGSLMVAEFGTMLGACAGGVGIARVKAIGVQRLLEQGTLVELLPDWSGDSFPLYALTASRQFPAAKVPGLRRLHPRSPERTVRNCRPQIATFPCLRSWLEAKGNDPLLHFFPGTHVSRAFPASLARYRQEHAQQLC